ncbi:MAG: non-canonical purine NTP pyrophosphatase [Candidatus Pacebacteria bacterium]|nr:non-canonical purine NTP pyrophosphatase [Candidatus Paceibacterota bacterium]
MLLYLITSNQGKFAEAQAILPQLKQIQLDLPEIQALSTQQIIEYKLKQAVKQTSQTNLIVEDTSLSLDALNGLPGPLIKWFLKTVGPEGLSKIAQDFGNQAAFAQVTIGYAGSNNQIRYFEGRVEGKIVPPRGSNGFGWDAIFEPANQPSAITNTDQAPKTYAEMSLAEKMELSMRRLAYQKLKDYLDHEALVI